MRNITRVTLPLIKASDLRSQTAGSTSPCSPASPPLKASQDESILLDSGYASSLNSPDQNPSQENPKCDKPTITSKSIPFPLPDQKDAHVFGRDISKESRARYNEIIIEIERLLLSNLKSGSRMFTKRRHIPPMSTRLMVIGKTEADAQECAVVFCDASLRRDIDQFLNKDKIVRDLLTPADPTVPSFKIVVKDRPRLRSADTLISIECDESTLNMETFCGAAIRFSNGNGDFSYGTFGGLVKVTYEDDAVRLLGMTAAHPMLEWDDFDDNSLEEDSHARRDKFDDGDEEDPMMLDEPLYELSDMKKTATPAKLWDFGNSKVFGTLLTSSGMMTDSPTGQKRPYLDWALFDMHKYLPNTLADKKRKDLVAGPHLSTSDGDVRSVIMVSGQQAGKAGKLSGQSARIMIGPDASFVDAFLLTLNEGSVIDGESGSYVVDPVTSEVYGHVVATDMFGEAYVIPIRQTLGDIQHVLGAKSVDLPTAIDLTVLALTEVSRTETLEDNGNTKQTLDTTREFRDSGVELTMPDFWPDIQCSWPGSDGIGNDYNFNAPGTAHDWASGSLSSELGASCQLSYLDQSDSINSSSHLLLDPHYRQAALGIPPPSYDWTFNPLGGSPELQSDSGYTSWDSSPQSQLGLSATPSADFMAINLSAPVPVLGSPKYLDSGYATMLNTPQGSNATSELRPKFRCTSCKKVFDKSADLKRHEAIHERGEVFICRCGYQQRRKDNYRRHVRQCSRASWKSSHYECKCGKTQNTADQHLAHVTLCQTLLRKQRQGARLIPSLSSTDDSVTGLGEGNSGEHTDRKQGKAAEHHLEVVSNGTNGNSSNLDTGNAKYDTRPVD